MCAAKSNQVNARCQTLPPGLYVVATPIGNLGDITRRALDVLACADLLLCEDTRVTGKLLAHFGIKARMFAYHDHNENDTYRHMLEELQAGKSLALVSDAGTPLISDPGYRLVSEAARLGIPVIPIPGASSVIAALSASGLPTDRFYFAGFLPAREAARRSAIAELAGIPGTLVLLESVHRLGATLGALAELLGPREAVIARELTKLYEELRRGSLSALAAQYAQGPDPKGEVVIVIGPASSAAAKPADVDALLREALKDCSVKDAAAEVAKVTGLPRQELYSRALALKVRP